MNNGQPAGVTWKWVAIASVSVIGVAGGGWMTYMQAQVTDIRGKQDDAKTSQGHQSEDIAVIKEKLRVIEDNQKEQKENAKDVNRKLDELLQKVRK